MATLLDELYDEYDRSSKLMEENDILRSINAELLASLRGIMKGYERRLGDWENANFNDEWNVAVSAISKAEGKTE